MRFTIYEPFAEPMPGGRRHLVIYAHRPDGTRHRAGSLDLPVEEAEEFLALWCYGGGMRSTAEELGLPVKDF